MPKRILTQEDLDNNPELVEQGCHVGDEIEIPETTEDNESFEPGDDGEEEGGGDRPGHKPQNP